MEEQRPELSSYSHNQEDGPSLLSHHQDEAEQGNTVHKSSSLGRLSQRSIRKVGLPPPDPLPTVKPFSKTYVKKKKRPFFSSQKARSPQSKPLKCLSAEKLGF